MTRAYLDASALVKLAVEEDETVALRSYVAAAEQLFTSRLAAVEVPRAVGRKGGAGSQLASVAWTQLREQLAVIELDAPIAAAAANAHPPTLRSLDAIHLASALSLGTELEAFVTYDARLADAARAAGLTVVAPA